MNASLTHRGPKALYEGTTYRVPPPEQGRQLLGKLAVLYRSRGPRDVGLAGLQLHPLNGKLRGHYAVAVSGNWRVTFRFGDGDAVDVDYLNYH